LSALYLDSSAFVKLAVEESDTEALRAFLAKHGGRRVSSSLLRAESLRAVRHVGAEALATVREGLRRIDLIGIDDRILDAAGTIEPRVLRTLDAIHLATAMAVGDDLEAIVTYDERMVDGAELLGLPTVAPRQESA
jgi:predicted nucleic acid-binding protein